MILYSGHLLGFVARAIRFSLAEQRLSFAGVGWSREHWMATWNVCEPVVDQLVAGGDWATIARMSLWVECQRETIDQAIVAAAEQGSYELSCGLLVFRDSGFSFFPGDDPPGNWREDDLATFALLRFHDQATRHACEETHTLTDHDLGSGIRAALRSAGIAAMIRDTPAAAYYLSRAGNGALALRDMPQARTCFEQALSTLDSQATGLQAVLTQPLQAACWGNLCHVYNEVGMPSQCLGAAEKCGKLYAKLFRDNHNEYWLIYVCALRQRVASLLAWGNDSSGALEVADQALDVIASQPGGEVDGREHYAALQHQRSVLLRGLGRADEAIRAARESLHWFEELASEHPGRHTMDVADSAETLANAYIDCGQLEDAAAASADAADAHRGLRDTLGQSYWEWAAKGLLRHALCLEACEFWEQAYAQFEHLKQWVTPLAEQDATVWGMVAAEAWNGSVRARHHSRLEEGSLDDLGRAELLSEYDRSIGLQRQLQDKGIPVDGSTTAKSLTAMARLFGESGDHRNANRAIEAAKAEWGVLEDDSLTRRIAGMSEVLRVEASLWAARGEREQTIRALKEGVQLFEQLPGTEPTSLIEPRVLTFVAFSAAVLSGGGRSDRATTDKAVSRARWVWEHGGRWVGSCQDPMLKRRIAAKVDRAAYLLLRYSTTLPGKEAEAFELAESVRSRMLRGLMADLQERDAAIAPELKRAYDQAKRDMQAAVVALTALDRDRRTQGESPEQLHERNRVAVDRYFAAQRAESEVVARIQEAEPGFDPRQVVPPIGLADFQDWLRREGTAAIHYTIADEFSGAFVVTAEDCRWIELPDCTASWSNSICSQWTSLLSRAAARTASDYAERRREEERLIAEFSSVALAPLSGALPSSGGTLLVTPHRELHLMPFEACQIDGAYLSDRWVTKLAPCPSTLRRPGPTGAGPLGSARTVVVDSEAGRPLFCREIELAALTDWDPDALRLDQAGSVGLEKLLDLCQNATTIHFCCHGSYRPENQMSSNLWLAEEHRSERWLRLRDVYERVDLRGQPLVVLSACRTGLLNPDDHDDFVSFPSAFLYAGARAVIATLWKCDDLASALLMDRFYSLRGEGRCSAEALNEAKRWLRGDRGAGGLESADSLDAFATRRDLSSLFPDPRRRRRVEKHLKDACHRAGDGAPFASPRHWAAYVLVEGADHE